MDGPDLLALIALLVSLIALLIALVQLLQSSALTAEGWRQCNATNMGQWSMFSRRKWLWSELRAEVRFTTPFIRLMDTDTLYNVEERREGKTNFFVSSKDSKYVWEDHEEHLWEGIFKRHGWNVRDMRPAELGWGMVFEEGSKLGRPETGLARAAAHILGFGTLPGNIELNWNGQKPVKSSRAYSFWQSCQRWFRGYHFRFEQQQLSSIGKTQAMSITWDDLLRMLLRFQTENFRSRNWKSTVTDVQHLRTDQRLSIPCSSHSEDVCKMAAMRKDETLFVLDLERRSWDFLPPDVSRPLARSTMKTVVILANRLGMRWRTFDLYREQYCAEGNGCSMTATNVRGVGTVFRFDRGYLPTPRPVLCTASADKAYFGIIPGDEKHDIKDYPLVNDDRSHDIEVLVKALGDKPKLCRRTLWFWSRIIVNDAVALMSPFMPLQNTRVPTIVTAIGTVSEHKIFIKVSLFKAIGLERKLRNKLNEQVKRILKIQDGELFPLPETHGSSIDTSVKWLFDNHWRLKSRGWSDNREDWKTVQAKQKNEKQPETTSTPTTFSSGTTDRKTIAIDEVAILRKLHGEVTQYFHQESIQLMHLVQAHMKFISEHMLDWYNKSDEAKRRGYRGKDHANDDLKDGWDTLVKFADDMMADLTPFRNNLVEISPDYKKFSNEKIEDFWWMLVARGVAWQCSVNVEMYVYTDMVPSSVHGTEMPVWIE